MPEILDVRENLDLALFRIKDDLAVSSMQGDFYDTPTAMMTLADIEASPFINVMKVGRRTGLTRGSIAAHVTGDTSIENDQPKFNAEVHYLDMVAIEWSRWTVRPTR